MKVVTSKRHRAGQTVDYSQPVGSVNYDSKCEAELEQGIAVRLMVIDKSVSIPNVKREDELPKEIEGAESLKATGIPNIKKVVLGEVNMGIDIVEELDPDNANPIKSNAKSAAELEREAELAKAEEEARNKPLSESELEGFNVETLREFAKATGAPYAEYSKLKKGDLIQFVIKYSASEKEQ